LEAVSAQLQQQKGSTPPEYRAALAIMEQFLNDRIAELSAADGGEE